MQGQQGFGGQGMGGMHMGGMMPQMQGMQGGMPGQGMGMQGGMGMVRCSSPPPIVSQLVSFTLFLVRART